ncbi:hypothetical protein DEU52_1136 [Ensifer adhaerens]|nr:hypothetical protein DEU52_1136 [Ensifer adhaerens]
MHCQARLIRRQLSAARIHSVAAGVHAAFGFLQAVMTVWRVNSGNSMASKRMDLARSIVRRYEEIRAGHTWRPPEWDKWRIHFSIGQFDDETVCANAQQISDEHETDSFLLAWRVEPSRLFDEINAAIAELRNWRPNAAHGELEALPLLDLNESILELVERDVQACNATRYYRALNVIRRLRGSDRRAARRVQ